MTPRPDSTEDGLKDPVLLAVDQELGEGTALWVAPELTDPVGPLDIGEHHDVEELGAGNRAEGVKAGSESALKLVRSHAGDYAEVPRPIVGQQS